jgi:2-desacetyl-2-hydroxyethyl bacteriochlorophyllide A dehydrogenase
MAVMELMKAARLHAIRGMLSIDSIPIPQLVSDDVLVDIRAAGICHSDINYRDGVSPVARFPITLGHEIAGVVAKKADHIAGIEEGDRVSVHYVISCGKCSFCTSDSENYCTEYRMIGKDVDGGFAEYVRVPARNVLKVPESIPFDQAAILGCAVSTAYHALKRGRTKSGDTILVNGVGGLGVHAVQLASKIFGAGEVIAVDVLEEKLQVASKLGANELVNSSEVDPEAQIREITKGKLVDVALDFVGRRNTIENALRWTSKGGRVIIVGISQEEVCISPYTTVIGKEMEIIGVNDHLKSELAQLIEYVESGRLDLSNSITHRVSLDDVNRGMQMLSKNIGNPIRVVVAKPT